MKLKPKITFIDHFSQLTNPRTDRTKEHKLIDIRSYCHRHLLASRFAYGADNWVAIE